MLLRMLRERKKGFTLIELMVVIAIILILALVAIPAYRNMQLRAKKARAFSDFRNIANALQAYYTDWNQYPTGDWEDLVNELTGSTDATINVSTAYTSTGERGGIVYMENIGNLRDPFAPDAPYTYSCTDGQTWELRTTTYNGTNYLYRNSNGEQGEGTEE